MTIPYKALAVYLGSSGRCRDVYKEATALFGKMIGQSGRSLVYGGMDVGLMGILANNAMEAGAHVTGIIPKNLKDSERVHARLQETILVNELWERKNKMFRRGKAVVCLPGGLGTVDEVAEVLYWAYLGLHGKPMIFLNIEGQWDDLLAFFETLPDYESEFVIVVDEVRDVFNALEGWSLPHRQFKNHKLPHFEDEILRGNEDAIMVETLSIRDFYFLATALTLKQLSRHQRSIGLLNEHGRYDAFLRWMDLAKKEKFNTEHCLELLAVAGNKKDLMVKVEALKPVYIDLHRDKWGVKEGRAHIEIRETE